MSTDPYSVAVEFCECGHIYGAHYKTGECSRGEEWWLGLQPAQCLCLKFSPRLKKPTLETLEELRVILYDSL